MWCREQSSAILMIMDQPTATAVRRFLAMLPRGQYDVAGAVLFGSRARGTHRDDSDADLAVILRGDHAPLVATKLAMSDIAFDVLIETGINISPLPVWADEWEHPERFSNPALLRAIAQDGVRL